MKHVRAISIPPAKCAVNTTAVNGILSLLNLASLVASLVMSSIAFDVNVDLARKKRHG